MGLAFKLMVFTLVFNIAAGILGVALGDYYESRLPIGYKYNESKNLADTFDGNANPPSAEGASGWWDKFTDFLRISFFEKIKSILDKSVYGMVGILQNLGIISSDYYLYFYGIITIIYMIGIVELFSGSRVTR